MPPILDGNEVTAFVDGEAAFAAMAEALLEARAPGDFIYVVNWFCDVDFAFPPGLNLRRVFERASDAGVMIRALLWKEPESDQNSRAVEFLDGIVRTRGHKPAAPPAKTLVNAAAIHDDRGDKPLSIAGFHILGSLPRALGSQHQKILCIFAAGKLISFCGGVDFREDRIAPTPAGAEKEPQSAGVKAGGAPLHDLHCRIEGPAAFELVKIFVEKWNDHEDGQKLNAKKGPLIVPPRPEPAGKHVVQVGRTYKAGVYGFCPEGDLSAAAMIGHAIRQAKRFIYTECQYFTGAPALLDALLDALPAIEHLTVLITHWEISDLPFVNSRRRRFLRALTANPEHARKVRLFTLQPHGNTERFQAGLDEHTYVHSKVWIVDDEFAVLGSVNSNQRSWMHDTEVAAGIYEPPNGQPDAARFAHALRIRLWQEHLNMETPAGAEALADGVASARYWLQPPPGARVRPHDLDERNAKGKNDRGLPFPFPRFIANSDLVWNNIFDPD